MTSVVLPCFIITGIFYYYSRYHIEKLKISLDEKLNLAKEKNKKLLQQIHDKEKTVNKVAKEIVGELEQIKDNETKKLNLLEEEHKNLLQKKEELYNKRLKSSKDDYKKLLKIQNELTPVPATLDNLFANMESKNELAKKLEKMQSNKLV